MNKIKRLWRDNSLARGTAWMGLAHGGRLLIQLSYFVLLTRTLGVSEFGVFAGVVAGVNLISPLAGWGSGNILIMQVSRDAALFRDYWSKALRITVTSGLCLSVLATLVAAMFLKVKIPLLVILFVTIADLVFGRLTDIASQASQAFEHMNRTAASQLSAQVARFIAAVVFVFIGDANLQTWASLYLAAGLIASLTSVIRVSMAYGWPSWTKTRVSVTGFYFSLSMIAKNLYGDVDKILLLNMGTAEATGVYSAAHKVINASFAPVQALMAASYSRFFREGGAGIHGAVALARKLLPFSAGYSLIVGFGFLILAPVAPLVLGADLGDTVHVLRLLAFVPLVQSLHHMAADTLTGAGYQKLRSLVQVVIGILNVCLNVVWLPVHSWRGAAWATLICESLLASVLWSYVWLLRRQRPSHGLDAATVSERFSQGCDNG